MSCNTNKNFSFRIFFYSLKKLLKVYGIILIVLCQHFLVCKQLNMGQTFVFVFYNVNFKV